MGEKPEGTQSIVDRHHDRRSVLGEVGAVLDISPTGDQQAPAGRISTAMNPKENGEASPLGCRSPDVERQTVLASDRVSGGIELRTRLAEGVRNPNILPRRRVSRRLPAQV